MPLLDSIAVNADGGFKLPIRSWCATFRYFFRLFVCFDLRSRFQLQQYSSRSSSFNCIVNQIAEITPPPPPKFRIESNLWSHWISAAISNRIGRKGHLVGEIDTQLNQFDSIVSFWSLIWSDIANRSVLLSIFLINLMGPVSWVAFHSSNSMKPKWKWMRWINRKDEITAGNVDDTIKKNNDDYFGQEKGVSIFQWIPNN